MVRNNNLIRIRVDRDIVEKLRMKYPEIPDRVLHRMTYQTSLMRVEVAAGNIDRRLSEVLGVKKNIKKR